MEYMSIRTQSRGEFGGGPKSPMLPLAPRGDRPFQGIPEHIRSDNGPEFCAKAVRGRPDRPGVGESVNRAGQSLGELTHRVVHREAAG
jgi:hypothetical protein